MIDTSYVIKSIHMHVTASYAMYQQTDGRLLKKTRITKLYHWVRLYN